MLFDSPARAILMGVIAASLELSAGVSFADDVEDGDTIEIQGQLACLYGIDALELGQTCTDARGKTWPCGIAAKATLATLIRGQVLLCLVIEEDFERLLSVALHARRWRGSRRLHGALRAGAREVRRLHGRRGGRGAARRWCLGRRVHAALAVALGRPLKDPVTPRAGGGIGAPAPRRIPRCKGLLGACAGRTFASRSARAPAGGMPRGERP